MKRISTLILAALFSFGSFTSSAQSSGPAPAAPASSSQATPVPATTPKTAAPVAPVMASEGTLVVDAKPFTSQIPLDKKVEDQLRGAGIEWGVKDGLFVQSGVNKQYVNFDISNLTRYGQSKSIAVPAGDYSITCIGMIPHTAFSVQAMLNKSAYVNENMIHFHVDAGKTTTLTITAADDIGDHRSGHDLAGVHQCEDERIDRMARLQGPVEILRSCRV